MDSNLQIYLREINQSRLLEADEEVTLARRIRKGDLQAREEMIRSNQRLVVTIVKDFVGRGLSLLDLIQEGNVGLLRAVEKFDPAQGCRFSNYAWWWIRQSIMRSLNNAANPVPVEIPAYMVEMIAKWRRTASQLEGEQGRVPTAEEIARAMGITRHKVELVARAARAFTVPSETETEADWSISDLVADEVSQPDVRVLLPDGSISDLVADEESRSPADVLLENRRTEAVMKHLNAIDGRAATILRLRFGTDGSKPMTLKDIGKQIGLTRERIRQIESDALKCINKAIRNQEGQM